MGAWCAYGMRETKRQRQEARTHFASTKDIVVHTHGTGEESLEGGQFSKQEE